MNHTTTSDPYSHALKDWWLTANGGKPMHLHKYKPGTRAREIYDRQIRRMRGLAGC